MEQFKQKRNIKPFDGDKYSIWKFRIRSLLSELNIIEVVDGEIPETRSETWERCNRMVKNILVEYLSDSYIGFVNDTNTAKEVFKNLDLLYERKSLATQLAIRKKLLGLKFQTDMPLIKHFTVFDDLITELSAAGAKLEETDKVAHLLLTLPATYNGVITAIETLTEDNLTLAFVKTRLLDQEVKLTNEASDTSAKVLHVENIDYKRKFNSGKPMYNSYKCNKKFKGQNNTNITKCFHCGRKGHIKKDCFYFKRSNKQKNTSDRTRTVQAVELLEASKSADFSGYAFLTGEYQQDNTADMITFVLDSGASDHIINRDDIFVECEYLITPLKISVAKNGEFISATKRGTIHVVSNNNIPGVLENVLYCREVPYNLLSVSKMQQAGLKIIFDQSGTHIMKGGKTIMKGKNLHNLITLDFKIPLKISQSVSQVCTGNNNNYKLWHQRLGHLSKCKFLELQCYDMIEDKQQITKIIPTNDLCEACINGKQTRLPFNKAKDKKYIKRPLYIVHSDVCGPITPSTVDNKNYYVLFIDQFTHYCVVYPLTYKSDVFSAFKDFVAKSEAKFNSKLVTLYSDNGGEYLSTEMKDFCKLKGISYHLTVPRTPQLNGVAERMVRTITEKARCILSGAKLDKCFWAEAVLTAVHLINITPTKALKQSKTPYELWHGRKPSIKSLRVFGSTVYVHNKTNKTKFDDKSWKGILVGYSPNGYKVWNTENEKYVTVRDVVVDETNFLVSRPLRKPEGNNVKYSQDKTDTDQVFKSVSIESQILPKSDNSKSGEQDRSTIIRKIDNEIRCEPEINSDIVPENNKDTSNEASVPRRSDRLKGRPPISYTESDDYLYSAQSFTYTIPKSFHEIESLNDRAHWQKAVKDELDSHKTNNTWTLVPRPNNKNIVDCKWIFTIKNDEFGKPVRYKARLVARGFSQKYLTDYNETFAPVARITSFRFIISFANQHNLLIHHMDVKTAFLNGVLKEEIYMKIPEGVRSKYNNYVCKLNKALYGLKQAARCWFEVFERSLMDKGFKNSPVDRCIYLLDKGNIMKNIYLVLYVDDLVIACADVQTMNGFKNYLMSKFKMTDLKEIKFFLGIKVTRYFDTITLDQGTYIQAILNKFNMIDCNPVSTPMEVKLNYEALNLQDKYDAPCRNLIGCLMYIMLCTRPDLSTSVNIFSRYTNNNNKELWLCLKRVLRYLKGTINLKLTYKRVDYNNVLCGSVDSDWGGGDTTDRKSTTGYLFQLFENCTISWSTKRQMSVAASSTEAEYMALYEAVREALWLKSLAISIDINIDKPILIYEDNTGCISIANNPTNHKRSKHIDIKYHFSREQVENKIITLEYIPTGQQLADVLTKQIPAITFQVMRRKMGLL